MTDHDDADLGEMDGEEDFIFPPAERKVVTQPLDLSVGTLVDQWNEQQLVIPEIQREYVWDNAKASRLIESLLLNIPVPVLYVAETEAAKYEVIDGHQRIRSIVRFVGNEFSLGALSVLREYRGLRFHQLPIKEQRFLKMRALRAIIIAVESHPNMKFEVFERLNTGAISLNAQELRNSIYRGDYNRLLHELAKNSTLRQILGSRAPRRRMVDEELVLRFFALRSSFNEYRTPLKRFLNEHMASVRKAGEVPLESLQLLFETTIDRVMALIGPGAFRLADANGEPIERQVNRALFDAHMLVTSWVVDDSGADKRVSVLSELAALYADPTFLDSVQRATGDKSRLIRRVHDTAAAFSRAGIAVQVPFEVNA